MRVAGLLLAAGAGRRFGGPKALVSHGGARWVESAGGVLRAAGCDPVVVVLGAEAARVRATAALGDAVVVDNADWPTGMGSSLRAGLAAAEDVDAVVVLPVDTPGITAAAVSRLAALAAPGALARASYEGVPGHPVLLGREHWPGVALAAVGDAGARDYLAERRVLLVPCEDVADGRDIDHPDDLP
ncbi:CTP:molybdopterin cytidylyltransferase MocA [Saccharothrix coeruleofusca]|uniref:nucleotidyltransferase family protein n=1 Tax=Saccharothrix coeruleofusca TaxID=33919 RepID=UPI001AE3BC0D|nr:nucleotidyltransferase family protein [Saccharothrix coeruleofusca]MBP2337720.1 CTP:molybdopterin cytidylyltransferase MocA [Saccharothrix coeruleofusca]